MNRKHFTLVEVLVVVGIIGILAGLIFPAVGMARQAGRRTECVSNQGQLMKLLTITMQANDNYLVSGTGYGQNLDTNPAWTRHLNAINKLPNLKGYRCPGLPTKENPDVVSGGVNAQFQAALGVVATSTAEGGKTKSGFDFRGTKRLTVTNGSNSYVISPNQLVIGGCSGWVDSGLLKPKANLLSGGNCGNFYLVHGDELNMFFLDGHVESVDENTAVQSKYVPDRSGTGATAITTSYIKNFED